MLKYLAPLLLALLFALPAAAQTTRPSSGPTLYRDSIANIRANDLSQTPNVLTNGYWSNGDGGGDVLYTNMNTKTCTDNWGSWIKEKNGWCFNAPLYPIANLRQWGARMSSTTAHPISAVYATLGAAQAVCPTAASLNEDVDWFAICALINAYKQALADSSGAGGPLIYAPGALTSTYRMTNFITADDMTLHIEGDGISPTKFIWVNGTECVHFGLADTGDGGDLLIRHITFGAAPGDNGNHVCIRASFGVSHNAYRIEDVSFSPPTVGSTHYGYWQSIASITGGSNAFIEKIVDSGDTITTDSPQATSAPAIQLSTLPTGAIIGGLTIRDSVFQHVGGCARLFTPPLSTSGFQGITIDNNECGESHEGFDFVNQGSSYRTDITATLTQASPNDILIVTTWCPDTNPTCSQIQTGDLVLLNATTNLPTPAFITLCTGTLGGVPCGTGKEGSYQLSTVNTNSQPPLSALLVVNPQKVPDFVFTNNKCDVDGWCFNEAGSTAKLSDLFAHDNRVAVGSGAGISVATGGGFNLTQDDTSFVYDNHISITSTRSNAPTAAAITGLYSNGTNGHAWNNTVTGAGNLQILPYEFDVGSSGWVADNPICVQRCLSSIDLGLNNTATGLGGHNDCTQNDCKQSGAYGWVAGSNNSQTGQGSVVQGTCASDFSNKGTLVFGGGACNLDLLQGGTQLSFQLLKGTTTSTTPLQLTADPNGMLNPNSCGALQNRMAQTFDLHVVAKDQTNTNNTASLSFYGVLVTRETGTNNTHVYMANTPAPIANNVGTGSSVAVTITADLTNGCPKVLVTSPNADKWVYGAALGPVVSVWTP